MTNRGRRDSDGGGPIECKDSAAQLRGEQDAKAIETAQLDATSKGSLVAAKVQAFRKSQAIRHHEATRDTVCVRPAHGQSRWLRRLCGQCRRDCGVRDDAERKVNKSSRKRAW